jgi:hypothetical protein
VSRVLLLIAALLLAACQQPPAVQPSPVVAVSPAEQLRAEGDALMARGDFAGALEKFRQAVDLEPVSVPLRFALGTAYSFLDKRPEAIAQFRWIVANAALDSREHQEARRWLAGVGVIVEDARVAAKSPSAAAAAEEAAKKAAADPAAQGSIVGETRWPGVAAGQEPIPLKISLKGVEEGTSHVGQRRDIAMGQRFEFKDVPQGKYRLVGVFDDRIIWDRDITVQGGRQTDVALDQGASSVPVSTFPLPAEPQPRQ